jgi:hypothetical protein
MIPVAFAITLFAATQVPKAPTDGLAQFTS